MADTKTIRALREPCSILYNLFNTNTSYIMFVYSYFYLRNIAVRKIFKVINYIIGIKE